MRFLTHTTYIIKIMTDSKTTVFCPVYYQIIQRRANGWAFKHGEPFINLFNVPNLSPEEEFIAFGTSMKKVAIELFSHQRW